MTEKKFSVLDGPFAFSAVAALAVATVFLLGNANETAGIEGQAPDIGDSDRLKKGGLAENVLVLAQEGRSEEEIVELVYQQALETGGWLVDIGVWRSLLDSEVRSTIRTLAKDGLLSSS